MSTEYMRQWTYAENGPMQNLMMFYSIVGFVMMIFVYMNQRSWDGVRSKYARIRQKTE